MVGISLRLGGFLTKWQTREASDYGLRYSKDKTGNKALIHPDNMKLKIILFIIYTTITQYGYAQVTNRALCLNGKGKVVFTPHEKLSLNKNQTFQFWMKVSRWVTDAHIIRCGEKEDSYTITLG